jgi:hypothetical protein
MLKVRARRQIRLSVPSEFTSSRENPVQLRAYTSFVPRAVKFVRSIQTQVLHVLNLTTHHEEVCECASTSIYRAYTKEWCSIKSE